MMTVVIDMLGVYGTVQYRTVTGEDEVTHAVLPTYVFTFCGEARPVYKSNPNDAFFGYDVPPKPVSCMLCLVCFVVYYPNIRGGSRGLLGKLSDMGHPMEGAYEAAGMERDRLWARRDVVEAKINKLSLAMFKGNQFADLTLLYDRKAPSERSLDLVKALERLEAFLEVIE